ncbi:MAG: OsmC family protein [Candidatus Thorarchaeota archaeon]
MTERQEEYHVRVEWTGYKSGIVRVQGRAEIKTGIPPDAEGSVHQYSPEELFVAAGTVCFMNSFVYFTEKMHIEFKAFEAESIGYLEQVDRSFEVTRIHTKTRLTISSEDQVQKFERALELGAKYCFVANSMKCPTTHEHEILIDI